LEKRIAVEFSFLLAIPTLFAASGLVIWQSRQELGSSDWFYLGLGFVVTLLSAWLTIRFFLEYLKKHSFTAFGWYRIVLASLYALLVR
jgi:undecaprenyl-diphosphatase